METEKPLGLKDYLFIAACFLVAMSGFHLMNIHKSYIVAAFLMTASLAILQIFFRRDIISEEKRNKEQKHLAVIMMFLLIIFDLFFNGLELHYKAMMVFCFGSLYGSSKIYNWWIKA